MPSVVVRTSCFIGNSLSEKTEFTSFCFTTLLFDGVSEKQESNKPTSKIIPRMTPGFNDTVCTFACIQIKGSPEYKRAALINQKTELIVFGLEIEGEINFDRFTFFAFGENQ